MRKLLFAPVLMLFVLLTAFDKPVADATAGFDFFRTHRQGKAGITATWGYAGEAAVVTGYVVEKTYEDPADPYAYWETVATVPATGARSYKVTDTGVYPGYISYRITAVSGVDPVTVSGISTVHIVSH